MKFYFITIECVVLKVFSIITLLHATYIPPEKWGDSPYYKTKLAKWIYNKTDRIFFQGLRFDLFHLASFHFYCLCSVVSVIGLIIDLSTGFALTNNLGTITLIVIFFSLIILFFSYEIFLGIWWTISNKNSQSLKEIRLLRKNGIIKEIMKKKKNKK